MSPPEEVLCVDWVCEYCGHEDIGDEPVDEVQCLLCGEAVTPKR